VDEKLRKRLGREAIKTVEEKYSLDSVANQYMALYADLLQHKAAAGHSGLEVTSYRESS
jgi:glycosyltransferase involved in cell wall biosynthesis